MQFKRVSEGSWHVFSHAFSGRACGPRLPKNQLKRTYGPSKVKKISGLAGRTVPAATVPGDVVTRKTKLQKTPHPTWLALTVAGAYYVCVAQVQPRSICPPCYITYKVVVQWPEMCCRATGRADERNCGCCVSAAVRSSVAPEPQRKLAERT